MTTASRSWLTAQSALSRPATIRLAAIGLLATAAATLQAWCIAQLAAPILNAQPPANAPLWATLFAAAALARIALNLRADAQSFEAGAAARRRLRTGYLVSAFAAGPHAAPTAAPTVAPTVAIDHIEALDPYFARWLPAAILAWASPLLIAATILAIDPTAALIMLAAATAVPIGMALAGIGAAAASARQFEAMARLQSRFLDRVRGIATIVLANQAEPEAQRLDAAATELARRTMRVLRAAFLSSAVLDAAAAATLIILAIRAAHAWQATPQITPATLFTLILVAEFFAPLRAFAAAYQDRIHATSAAEALHHLPGPAPRQTPQTTRTVAASGITIAFDHVRYTWDPARPPALDGLSFRAPPNETLVLIGPSGAGKSTVIELLLGFIHPQSGRITLNGADLASITPAALSRITAWIGQRPTLFAGSIRDNIRFGQPDATDPAIEAAAHAAGLTQVAATLPQGLDTEIGEAGYGLSGGQAQRVAIARAFLRNAPLLLLDEPTAHLDPATEADVLDSLRRLAIGRTVILAAHSSAAIAFGGRRLLLASGREAAAQGAAQGAA